MRLIKMTSLAAVAAVAAMAFVGASSALAGNSQMCTQDPANGTCPAGSATTHEHFVAISGIILATLLGVHVEILCPNVLFLSSSIGALGAPQKIAGNFSYGATGSCTNLLTGKKCGTVEEVGTLGGVLDALRTGSETGTVTGLEFEILAECAGLHCIYEAEGVVGTVSGALGGGHGKISMENKAVKKVTGFACPASATLFATAESLTDVFFGI